MANHRLVVVSSLLCVLSGALFFVGMSGTAQQPKQPKQPPQPRLEQSKPLVLPPKQLPNPGFGGGRVVELPSDRLPRFKQPIPQPPKHYPHPPQRPGGHWHWHPSRGHVWLPGPVVSPTYILPPTYQLPPRVHYYEQPAKSYVVCPHCGQTIILE